MQNQKSQIFDGLKKLLLINANHSVRLSSTAVESGRVNIDRRSHLYRYHAVTCSHKGALTESSKKNTCVRHAQNFLLNAVAISICMTALILSMDALPVIFKVIAFCGSLMAGFIIEFMLNGDEYE